MLNQRNRQLIGTPFEALIQIKTHLPRPAQQRQLIDRQAAQNTAVAIVAVSIGATIRPFYS